MKSLRLDATKDTPKIDFDIETNIFTIEGKCHPENITIYFEPIMEWFDAYFESIKNKSGQEITLHLKYEYVNSASFKYLVELLRKMEMFHTNDIPVKIIWHYDREDDDMRDSGIELFEMVETTLPHSFQSYMTD